MANMRFVAVALVVSAVSALVFFFNFSADRSTWIRNAVEEMNRGGGSSGPLELEQGRSHVLVTGGAGFIGSHAALTLLDAGHTVTVIDNLSRGNLGALRKIAALHRHHHRFHFEDVDLGDKAEVLKVLSGAKPAVDIVMHFAAVAYVGESMRDPLRYYSNITSNTVNLLEAMREAKIHKLVYSSTCAVYGDQVVLPITELTPPKPINPYGQAKLFAEEAIRAFTRSQPSFKVIILRYFNVIGSDPLSRLGEFPRPELRSEGRISGACLDAALGVIPHLTIRGTKHPTPDGTCVRDYVHVSDLVAAHIAGMSHTANPPVLYNVGTGRGVSVRKFVDTCRRVTGANIKIIEQAEARPGDYAEVYADVSKIQKDLGWRANYTDVEKGLAHAWAWRKMHQNGYSEDI